MQKYEGEDSATGLSDKRSSRILFFRAFATIISLEGKPPCALCKPSAGSRMHRPSLSFSLLASDRPGRGQEELHQSIGRGSGKLPENGMSCGFREGIGQARYVEAVKE